MKCLHVAIWLYKIMAPPALSPLTARDHPETRLVSVSIHFDGFDSFMRHSCVTHVRFVLCVCVWLPGVVVTSHVPSSLPQGECV